MPTTSTGVPYTARTWTNATGDPSIWAVADRLRYDRRRKPVLLYCHGNGGEYNAFTTGSQYKPLRDRVIDAGWVYVETRGGHVSHWGREFAMQSYAAALKEAATKHPLGTVVIHGRSMGGTVASSLAVKPEWGISQHVVGLLLESAVQDMYTRHMVQNSTLGGQYPEGRPSHGGDPAAFAAAVAPFDPISFDPALYANMPVQFIHGTADTTVLPSTDPQAQLARISGVAPYADLVLRTGGTHSVSESADPRFVGPAWEFMRRAQGTYPARVHAMRSGSTARLTGVFYAPGWREAIPLTGTDPIPPEDPDEPQDPEVPEEPPAWTYADVVAGHSTYESVIAAFGDYATLLAGPPDPGE